MKWLVFGHKGWIGGNFCNYIQTARPHDTVVGAEGVRAENALGVRNAIETHQPDVVVCVLGRTHGWGENTIDCLETRQDVNLRDNLHAPMTVALECNLSGTYCIYIGTGCIFSYTDDKKTFSEEDLPNFTGSSYSRVKGITDQLMKSIPNVLNLRIRMPISGEPSSRNFITKITSYKKIASIPNSMTVLESTFPYIVKLAEEKVTGTLNFTNPGTITHAEILKMYTEIVDPDFKWSAFTEEEFKKNKISSNRSNNELDCDKLIKLFPDFPNIKVATEDALHAYAANLKGHGGEMVGTMVVTGGLGFIGSAFVNRMYHQHPRLRLLVIDSEEYCADHTNIDEKIRHDTYRYEFVKASVADSKAISSIFKNRKIDYIVHFAAESHVDNSFESSLKFTETNVLGTHVLLQAFKNYCPDARFVHISTDEVYGENFYNGNGADEGEKPNPTNPYAASKAGAEDIVNSYIHSFKLDIVVVRMNNVFGPRQFPEKLIPKFLIQSMLRMPMTVHGGGATRRSFVYVDDVTRGIDLLVQQGASFETYNVGTDCETTVLEVAQAISALIPTASVTFVEDRPFNDKRYFIDSAKIRKLGWAPTVDFATGLRTTYEWYKARPEWFAKLK